MPDWLRPRAAQIVTAHPAWVDMMPWYVPGTSYFLSTLNRCRPKSRDRLCRDAQYHDKFEDFKNACNETISINWPYEPADTLIRVSASEFTVNPVFITHIRTNSNWTLGPSFLEK